MERRRQGTSKPDVPLQFKVRQFSASPRSHSDTEQTSITPTTKATPKSKGLNVFAVSPLDTGSMSRSQSSESTSSNANSVKRRSSILSNNTQLPLLSESEDETCSSSPRRTSLTPQSETALPSKDHLLQLSIDEQLRILALKEMAIVQIKEQMQNLKTKLHTEEGELHKLREVVQRSLYQEISGAASNTAATVNRQRTNSNPRDQAIESIRAKRRSSSGAARQLDAGSAEEGGRPSKLWSGITKPFNMLQQFDTMLQNEFEKSLVLDEEKRRHEQQRRGEQPLQLQSSRESNRVSQHSRRSEESTNGAGGVTSPMQSGTAQSLSDYRSSDDRHSDDVIQKVSDSIWSFVNDVKQNVLSSLNEEDMANKEFDVDDQTIDFSMYKR
ncbi:hypothetical protein KGF57_004831 [Candida theae]|uniref:TDA11 n=1 Tax=Candida theae TaxID=1198502 RepID=A0AAD5BAI3_9ASCO|nr:TDA11 [Candida theae]XP_051606743.1 uncharacterized protein KGF57_004831 [Candida theae]KAI5949225.1 TDA11 [Candida theae]KAI5949233.1 hypothetical protein KGF57_004831 [Candida theae]